MFLQTVVERDGPGPPMLTVVDVVTGRTTSAYTGYGDAPTAAGGFAVSDKGVLTWISEGVRYALVGPNQIVVVP